jgi:hypothetical protein
MRAVDGAGDAGGGPMDSHPCGLFMGGVVPMVTPWIFIHQG